MTEAGNSTRKTYMKQLKIEHKRKAAQICKPGAYLSNIN